MWNIYMYVFIFALYRKSTNEDIQKHSTDLFLESFEAQECSLVKEIIIVLRMIIRIRMIFARSVYLCIIMKKWWRHEHQTIDLFWDWIEVRTTAQLSNSMNIFQWPHFPSFLSWIGKNKSSSSIYFVKIDLSRWKNDMVDESIVLFRFLDLPSESVFTTWSCSNVIMFSSSKISSGIGKEKTDSGVSDLQRNWKDKTSKDSGPSISKNQHLSIQTFAFDMLFDWKCNL